MSKRFTILTVALAASVAFLCGVILAGEFTPGPVVSGTPRPTRADVVRPAGLAAIPTVVNFADVAAQINAAVVNIDSTSRGQTLRDPQRPLRRGDSPADSTPRDPDTPHQGSGSGFIIDHDGFILTNFHVIDGADRVGVTLTDGRTFKAEIVGTDPAIDVALLRIAGGHDLPWAPLGNSDDLRAGEWVCAIGNPLGYVHSVTVGVVSFIGRKLFDPSLDDYIQTDAAINLGNSGGPLINTRGEVIGINSAISSRASNIGFAVPINQAVEHLGELKTRGRVSRGYMGVLLTDVTPALQRSLNLGVARGALVQDVTAGSPAERAGLRPYDVILDVDGRDIDGNETLIRDISGRQPGTVARLEIMRETRRLSLPVKLAERPQGDDDPPGAAGLPGARQRSPEPASEIPLGLSVREMDRGFVGRLEVPDSVQGVVVSKVDPAGPAFTAAIRRGYVIMEINRKPVRSVDQYQRIVTAAKAGDVLALYYYDPASSQRGLAAVTVE